MEPAVSVRGLRVDFENVCAVRDLSLEIGAGEVFGLIGPNGAGKTTTMRALLGLLEPTWGEIRIGGVDVLEDPRAANRIVGFMPDFPPIYDDLFAWEFLDLFAASYGVPKSRRREVVDRHLEAVGLAEKRGSMIPELSRGMRQRLVLAKTLIPEPRVILLDEPASGMDPIGRADLKNVLRSLAAEGRTILVSSHILSEMGEFCTSIGIMEKGRLVVSGDVASVTRRVMGVAVMVVEVVGPAEPCANALEGRRGVGAVSIRGEVLEFPFEGDDAAASDLLAALVGAGVRVVSFSRRKEGLEEVFLRVGAKELS